MDSLALRVGSVIRRYRTAAGLSQEAMAHRAGLHRTYVSLVERGQRNITLDALVRIGTVLGVEASQMVAESERTSRGARHAAR